MDKAARKAFKALVFGPSGATGREVVSELLNSPNWEKVSVITRRKIDRWEQLPENQKNKLDIVLCDDMDALFDSEKWKFPGYDSVFSCLGTTSLRLGKEMFYKIEHDYSVQSAKIAKANNITHFALVSGGNADAKSRIYYSRVKGETEDDIITLGIPYTSLFKPAMLANRDNNKRVVETIVSWIPFIPSIETKDLAKAMTIDAELRLRGGLDEKMDSELKVKANTKDGAKYYYYENEVIKEILKLQNLNL